MKIHIITIGEPKLSFAKDGFEFYIQRLSRLHDVHVTHVRDDERSDKKMHDLLIGGSAYIFICDEHGKEYTSREFSQKISDLAIQGTSSFAFVIGGPDGHTEAIKSCADSTLSLGRMTLPHDIAMLVTAEALYRSATIQAGHPYHRD